MPNGSNPAFVSTQGERLPVRRNRAVSYTHLYYPYSSLAAQVMGCVSTDNVGSEGLEAYYDSYLQGTAGKVVTTKGNYGSEMLYTYEKYYDASDGDSLVTTIDQTVQHYLEKNLATAIEKYDIINGAFGLSLIHI